MTRAALTHQAVLWSHWLTAVRPATLSAAVTPVLVGAAVAGAEDRFRPLVFVATVAAAVLIQIGTNLANDLFDFERGADTSERLGPQRVTQSGLIAAEQVRLGTFVSFGAAAAIGLYLMFVGGWPILAIGVLAIAAGVAYTGGPWPLGYHGLGDLMVFTFFGLVAVVGTYYLQAETVSAAAVLAAVPVGLLVTAILVVNNLRDVETDRQAEKRTLAVRLGERSTRFQYALLVLGPYACVPTLLFVDVAAWVWLSWLTLPVALAMSRSVLLGASGHALNPILKRTAQLHLVFGSLLALGLLL